MPIGWAMRLIRKAIEEKAEARAWQLYCSAYPNMDKKHFKTFEQFYPKRKKQKATKPITKKELDRFADIADLINRRANK